MHTALSIIAAIFLMIGRTQGQDASEASIQPTRFSGTVEFDRTVYDFGDIQLSDGAVTCSFSMKNISAKPVVIYNVVSSCGCTGVKWSREPILPGKSGKITATYSNDEGPYPFDKTLTVYISDIRKPVILRLRGASHSKKLSLKEMFGTSFGDLAFKDADIKCGNLEQGQQKSGEVPIANLGKSPAKISFKDISEGLALNVIPNPIPAQGTAKMTYTITADRKRWGRNYYYATPLVNGMSFKAAVTETGEESPDSERGAMNATDVNGKVGAGKTKIGIWAFTKENFDGWSKEQLESGAEPMFSSSTCTFGKIRKGKKLDAIFELSNSGKSTFTTYKVDSDCSGTYDYSFPSMKPGEKGRCKVRLDTSGLPKGETLVILTLTTNSPLRPVINLYITGWII